MNRSSLCLASASTGENVTCQNFMYIKFINFKDSRGIMRETSDFNRNLYKGIWYEGWCKRHVVSSDYSLIILRRNRTDFGTSTNFKKSKSRHVLSNSDRNVSSIWSIRIESSVLQLMDWIQEK